MGLLILLIGWLASRLVFLFYDDRLPVLPLLVVAAVQLAWSIAVIGLGLASVGFAAGLALLLVIEERGPPVGWLNESRLAALALVLLVVALTWQRLGMIETKVASTLWRHTFDAPLWIIFGLLLCANEANLVIRSLFHIFHLEPRATPDKNAGIDKREYNAGRIIGILERWLMYVVLVASQNYSVVAIIVAAKGFARFREMDDREFAEYVLIGTLASTLLTIAIAEAVILLKH